MSTGPLETELLDRAARRGIAIVPAALPAVVQGAEWLRNCVALIDKAKRGM